MGLAHPCSGVLYEILKTLAQKAVFDLKNETLCKNNSNFPLPDNYYLFYGLISAGTNTCPPDRKIGNFKFTPPGFRLKIFYFLSFLINMKSSFK